MEVSIFAAALVGMAAMLRRGPAGTDDDHINSLSDPSSSGNCTLRDALNVAMGGSPATGDRCASNSGGTYTITFTVTGIIGLSNELPTITPGISVNILGPTTSPGITINAFGSNELFKNDGLLDVNNLTLTRGETGTAAPSTTPAVLCS